MKNVFIKDWEIEVDWKKTTEYYVNLDKDELLTCCLNCKNFFYAIKQSSKELLELFTSLGIIPELPARASEIMEIDGSKHLYDVYYVFFGEILKRPKDAEFISENGKKEVNTTMLIEGINFHFSETLNKSLDNDFVKEPNLHLELFCEIPWVLNDVFK